MHFKTHKDQGERVHVLALNTSQGLPFVLSNSIAVVWWHPEADKTHMWMDTCFLAWPTTGLHPPWALLPVLEVLELFQVTEEQLLSRSRSVMEGLKARSDAEQDGEQ